MENLGTITDNHIILLQKLNKWYPYHTQFFCQYIYKIHSTYLIISNTINLYIVAKHLLTLDKSYETELV